MNEDDLNDMTQEQINLMAIPVDPRTKAYIDSVKHLKKYPKKKAATPRIYAPGDAECDSEASDEASDPTQNAIPVEEVCATAGCCGAGNKFRCKGIDTKLGDAPFDELLTCCDQNGGQFMTNEGPATACKSGECLYNDTAYQAKCDDKIGRIYTSCGAVNNACNSPTDCDNPDINPPPPDPATEPEKYPLIELKGAPYVKIQKGQTWTEPGWDAWANSSNKTGDISSSVDAVDPVDTNSPRVYTIYYRVENSLGWTDTDTRIVEVEDPDAP